MDRNELLENVRNYSPMEIARAIKNGVVTLYDLKKYSGGKFSPLMQRRVQEILNSGEILEEPQESQEPQELPEIPAPTPSITEVQDEGLEIPAPVQQDSIPEVCDDEDNVTEMFIPSEEEASSAEYEEKESELPPPPPPFSFSDFPPPPPPPEKAPQPRPDMSTFSWGGLFGGWIWGISNGVYWSLLSLVFSMMIFLCGGLVAIDEYLLSKELIMLIVVGVIVGKIITHFMLGILGIEAAWKARRYESVQEFERIQRGWNIGGFIFFIFSVGIIWIICLLIL